MSSRIEALFPGMTEKIERELDRALHDDGGVPARLLAAMRYAVFSGGKRLRPLLCLGAARAAGGNLDAALKPAAAVELLHTYTLVHDDLPCMDDDAERRGKPTVHVKFGVDLAVLTGDALQALAFAVLAEAPGVGDVQRVAMVRVLAGAAGPRGVVGGQVEDVSAGPNPGRDLIDFVHHHKTADLFEAALRLGGLAAGAAPPVVDRLGGFGRHLGLAFQVVDDLLDADAVDPAAAAPELNCLLCLSPAEARAAAAAHTAAARDALAELPGEVAPLDALAALLLERGV